MKIIITVPHGLCLFNHRDCDKRATEAANILYEKFVKNDIFPILYTSTWHRATMDLNRFESIMTEWRQNLEKTILSLRQSGEPVVLIDMHSFPNDSFGAGNDIVFLATTNDNIIKKLAQSFIVKRASAINDLQYTLADYSFLMEVNEDKKILTNEQLRKSLDDFVKFIMSNEFKQMCLIFLKKKKENKCNII